MLTLNTMSPEALLSGNTIFKYRRRILPTTCLPIWVRLLPSSIFKVDLQIDDEGQAQKISELLMKWFENITTTTEM